MTHYLLMLILGPVLVELVGYFWHRIVEHRGLLGHFFSERHIVHHEHDYPIDHLRRRSKYKSSQSWTWHFIGVISAIVMIIVLPLDLAVVLISSCSLYIFLIISNLHKAYHIENHWLSRFAWFRKMLKLHDIHHYQNTNYGICFFVMDRIFGTYSEEMPEDGKQNLFFFTSDSHSRGTRQV